MNVQRIEIARHPLLRELAAFLASVEAPRFLLGTMHERGDWRADIEAGPPDKDRPKPLHFRRHFMKAPIRLPGMPDDTTISALNYYPAGGSGIGWHTDSRAYGWRVYLARPLSFVPGFLITAEACYFDQEGWGVAFETGPGTWHAVHTDGPRLSIGIRIRGNRTARLLGLTTKGEQTELLQRPSNP